MTIIRILLIGGLVYIALQQKKESTRNVILVVTGLLAFCMMGKEGLQVYETATGAQGVATCIAEGVCEESAAGLDAVPVDAAACLAVTDKTTRAGCEAVLKAAGGGPACMYQEPSAATICTLSPGTSTCTNTGTGSGTCTYVPAVTGTTGEARAGTTADFKDLVTGCNIGTVIGAATGGSPRGSCGRAASTDCSSQITTALAASAATTDPTLVVGCGPAAECSASPLAPAVTTDPDNTCDSTLGWSHTCECDDDDHTWAPGVGGAAPTCTP
jgi:hypothetical protein